MTTIQIGQWSPTGQKNVDELESDGAIVIKAELITLWAPFGGIWLGWLTGIFSSAFSKILIGSFDRLIYAGWVSVRIGKQASVYFKDQMTGNTTPAEQSQTDQDADNLIHVGNV